MDKSPISMAMFNNYVDLPEGNQLFCMERSTMFKEKSHCFYGHFQCFLYVFPEDIPSKAERWRKIPLGCASRFDGASPSVFWAKRVASGE